MLTHFLSSFQDPWGSWSTMFSCYASATLLS